MCLTLRSLGSMKSSSLPLGVTFPSHRRCSHCAAAEDAERALALVDEGLAKTQSGAHAFLPRVRGYIPLKRNPADPAPAEDTSRPWRAQLRVAPVAGAREAYQTARPIEAHATLAPSLEGRDAGDRRGAGANAARGVGLRRAVKLIARSQWNAGYGADSGHSRGGPCRPAIRPSATFLAVSWKSASLRNLPFRGRTGGVPNQPSVTLPSRPRSSPA
jgi:hypothetical protein